MKINIQNFVRARSTRLVLAASLIAVSAIGFAPYVFNDVSTQAAINAPLIRLSAPVDGTVADLPADGRYFAKASSIRLLDLSQDTGDVADLAAAADLAQAQIDLAQRQLAELRSEEQRLEKRASAFNAATSARLGEDRGEPVARGVAVACLRAVLRRRDGQHAVDEAVPQAVQDPLALRARQSGRGHGIPHHLHPRVGGVHSLPAGAR